MSQGDYNSPEYWDVVYAGEKSSQWRSYPETAKKIIECLEEAGAKHMGDKLEGFSTPWIVDLGCGQGQITREISKAGYHVYGVDHSEEACEQARARRVDCLQMTVGDWIKGPYFAEATVMAEVLEHFTEEDGREIIQLLAKKGCKAMIFAVPDGVLSPGEHKEHMSGWTMMKFTEAAPDGYEVFLKTFVDSFGPVELPVLLCMYKKRLTEE